MGKITITGGVVIPAGSGSLTAKPTPPPPFRGFEVSGAEFDGTNDWLTRGALSGPPTDGPRGMLGGWFKKSADDTTGELLVGQHATEGELFESRWNSSGFIGMTLWSPNGASIAFGVSSSPTSYTTADGWIHILFSWDTSIGPNREQLFVNGISVGDTGGASNSVDIDYTMPDWSIGGAISGSNKFPGDIAEFYFNTVTSLDLDTSTNIEKFIFDGKPVDLGANGQTPTGSSPTIYLKGGGATFNTNLGSGGDFTVNGSLTDSADSPND